jgi:uncharacterized protein (DUF697 family)
MANNTTANAVIFGAAGTVAVAGFLNPVPLLDYAYIFAAWAGMLATLAPVCGAKFDKEGFYALIKSAFASVAAYMLGVYAFITAVKWTGIGTIPAAIVNAALNFSFTVAVGKIYEAAWSEGREPAKDELTKRFTAIIEQVRGMDSSARKRLKARYDALRGSGKSQKDALIEVLTEYFGFE